MSERTADTPATKTATRTEWARLPADPDAERDLGYRLADWDVVRMGANGNEQCVFLPSNEEQLRDEAFIVADGQSVCDLTNRI